MNMKKDSEQKNCCAQKSCATKEGIIYGIIPHIGCIAFLIFAVMGATVATTFLRPLMASQSLFYGMMALSALFAMVSASFYLKKHNALSWEGVRSNRRYLASLFGMTILTNALFLFVIFPAVANSIVANNNAPIGSTGVEGATAATTANSPAANPTKTITLKVDIPCGGHAPLITQEIKTLTGVKSVKYMAPKTFIVECDASLSTEEILGLDIFNEFKAILG